jgi:hypothetical protein
MKKPRNIAWARIHFPVISLHYVILTKAHRAHGDAAVDIITITAFIWLPSVILLGRRMIIPFFKSTDDYIIREEWLSILIDRIELFAKCCNR